MLYKCRIFLFFIFLSLNAQGQKWHKQNINNELTASFPDKPVHSTLDDYGVEKYGCQYDNCYFSIEIKGDLIDNYYGFLLESDSIRESFAMETLESFAEAMVNQPFHYLISKQSKKLGPNDYGLDIVFATEEPTVPESNKRYSKLLLIGNSLYIFEVFYIDGEPHDSLKDKFFNSINFNKKIKGG